MLLTMLSLSFAPSVSLAQQPTATIKTASGTVLVSGQAATVGTVLQAGDTIQTQAGASAVLELSDGSEIRIGENTQMTMTDLTQTATGARISTLNLVAGRVRAFLSPDHQQAGSAFTIETPNARIDATFSEPDIEVSYNPESVETVGIAHTVKLMAKNLATDEEILVPVGSSVIITGATIKVAAGIIGTVGSTETGSSGASTTGGGGMGWATITAIGLGTAAAVGGGIALAADSSGNGGGDDGSNVSFTGTFVRTLSFLSSVYTFTQEGTSVTGTFDLINEFSGGCTVAYTVFLTGTVDGNGRMVWSWPFKEECCPCGSNICCPRLEAGDYIVVLSGDINTLSVSAPPCTIESTNFCMGGFEHIRQ